MGELSAQDRAILDMEGREWRVAGRKEDAVRDELGLTPTIYYMKLGALLEREEALAYNPLLVGRLRRRRDARG